ncbi:hypothetical protein MC7420_4878 [Coleofasciculus chthonoplastes PCC 7420]|uniref:Uncharacterized protein n=1 Tax=Coleofasciculus chthonoplastes PCC 7420 TaxID=118168 RepID=B4VP20_9CYAN|nr:hypothetical protein MC7420_4878 [Coleofasciculus chthonoplastes PCC 7420]
MMTINQSLQRLIYGSAIANYPAIPDVLRNVNKPQTLTVPCSLILPNLNR